MLTLQAITQAQAEMAVEWTYPPPYDVYNISVSSKSTTVESFLRPDYHYYAVTNGPEFVAFRCFGPDAQVPGGDYSVPALDMGGGIRPDLTGRGLGGSVLSAALKFGAEHFAPQLFRTTVADFNLRALRVCEKMGYERSTKFFSHILGRSYIVMTCPVSSVKCEVG